MLEDIKESILNFITSRIFVLVVIFLAFFGIMMSRIFYLQIINGQNYADSFTMRIKREVSLPGTRGRIYDKNGQVLADNVLSYSVTMEDNGTYKSAREKQSTLNRTVLKVIDIVESHGDNVISALCTRMALILIRRREEHCFVLRRIFMVTAVLMI